ncbi:MAG: MarR family transcriptional regulator [Micrococcaceae bacterium]|nr:MarR family transcriptional regulator [Micrococcaceae bacterium]
MKTVKGPEEATPVVELLGRTLDSLRPRIIDATLEGVRPSHFRVMSLIPVEGLRPSELADLSGISSAGIGQFAAFLAERKLVTMSPDPRDSRARLIFLSPHGSRALEGLRNRLDDAEAAWQRNVGEEDYATFRKVLERLAFNVVD